MDEFRTRVDELLGLDTIEEVDDKWRLESIESFIKDGMEVYELRAQIDELAEESQKFATMAKNLMAFIKTVLAPIVSEKLEVPHQEELGE